MSAVATTEGARLDLKRSQRTRRLLIAATLVAVSILLLIPLVGILWTALEPGLSVITDTLAQPDVRHAFEPS